ncbi:PREDICTED: putative DMBT1-like protein [Thamnophis sirtalis]|uniref:DMBT1-like protein n=1 Tax=Thamnophis sirtalis TaxID=35019 RepID=A0A6I9YTJ3_9SAUR|nr:PREDICTED: putative DMBT1-like protein [Thamnophis sirtalis]
MDHTLIFLWVLLLSATASTVSGVTPLPSDVSATAEPACGGSFSDASGSFFGPYYAAGNRMLTCVWRINSPEYYPIRINLDYINLDCASEYIAVYKGEPQTSTLLGKICEGEKTFYSYSGMMTLVLYRHSNTEGQGFIAFYDVGAAYTTPLPIADLTTRLEETSGIGVIGETSALPTSPSRTAIILTHSSEKATSKKIHTFIFYNHALMSDEKFSLVIVILTSLIALHVSRNNGRNIRGFKEVLEPVREVILN